MQYHEYIRTYRLTNYRALLVCVADSGQCIWYGQCGEDPTTRKPLNCVNNGTARPFRTARALQLYKNLCPDLYKGPDTVTCCSDSQMVTLADSVAVPVQSLGRCPSCLHNFLNVYCYFTCAPDHSRYVYPKGVEAWKEPRETQRELERVTEVDYALSPEFAVGMYNSCQDVQMPSANMRAIGLLCGGSADDCSAQKWLDYMGNTDNAQTPFKINFNLTDQPYVNAHNHAMQPLNAPVIPCSRGLGGSSQGACSCQDCRDTCSPTVPPPSPPAPFEILGMDGYWFIMIWVFVGFVVVFVVCIVWKHCRRRASVGKSLDRILERGFRSWGGLCARWPRTVLVVGVGVAGCLSCGLLLFHVITDPVLLWSSPGSRARVEKEYFDQHFAPFYRIEQVIITRAGNHTPFPHMDPPPSSATTTFSPLFQLEFLHQVLDLQLQIQALRAPWGEGEEGSLGLGDICFQPLAPDHQDCTIQSVLNYFQNDHHQLDRKIMDDFGFFVMADYLHHLMYCVRAPATVNDTTELHDSCLGTYGGPVFPWTALGGYDGTNYQNATALVITFVVNNHREESENAKAEAWETEFIRFMKNYTRHQPNMTIAFSAQRSIEDELDRESESDVMTIVISYLIMFAYIAIFLGHFRRFSTLLVDSKVTVGVGGVVIVLLSVAASLGFFSYLGQPATLIIIEVVPFLVLAVGVDNIFILVQTFQRDRREAGEKLDDQIGRVMGKAGPSMLLTSLSESLAFFLGGLTDMPAVKMFSLYAAMAVLFDFLLQISCFVSLMTLDARRMEDNRPDVVCCTRVGRRKGKEGAGEEGVLFSLIHWFYGPFLLSQWVRPVVMVVFVGWFCASVAVTPRIEVGLDQSLAMPKDSYVLDYFSNLTAYLSVGAPVYFVVRDGYDYSSVRQQNGLCGGNGCLENSLLGQLYTASKQPDYTRIAHPATSWIDDYVAWLTPGGNTPCCRLHNHTGQFCPASSKDLDCVRCDVDQFVGGRPQKEDFMEFLPAFLSDNPNTACAKGGHAAYGSGVHLLDNKTRVGATYFMTYHTVLKTSSDYVDALKKAREIGANISATLRHLRSGDSDSSPGFHDNQQLEEVFPYSVFYVFYEQYLTIVQDTVVNLAICLSAILAVTFVLLGCDLHSALLVIVTLCMILADLLGLMYFWGISLNAVSLVNLIMAVGISVEFCSHIVRAFAVSSGTSRIHKASEALSYMGSSVSDCYECLYRIHTARDALSHMGSSVLSGITLTKLGGIVVLAFSKSQLFQVFYFRMYMGIVLFGAAHGLVFLPVLLTYLGPGVSRGQPLQQQQTQEDPDCVPEFDSTCVDDEADPRRSEFTPRSAEGEEEPDRGGSPGFNSGFVEDEESDKNSSRPEPSRLYPSVSTHM
ncbi:hypothetical protein ACOMHN_032275 [Nucella lapillus]